MALINVDDEIYKELVNIQTKQPIEYPNTRNLVNRVLKDWLRVQPAEPKQDFSDVVKE